jgi:hypothetical protein
MIQADSVLSTPPTNTSAGTPAERPADSVGSILSGLATQQRERETALHTLARLRKEASAEIHRLLAFLDASDPYVATEIEDDGDDEDGGDAEPSLGSFDRMTNQEKSYRETFYAVYSGPDAEQDDADAEPSLGSIGMHAHSDQENWAMGDRRDVEQDPAESGIGDFDGLAEQLGSQDWQQGGMV